MWQAILEALPCGRCYGDVIGKINAPVRASKDLLRLIGIDDNGVNRNVGEIAGLVRPSEGTTIRGAGYLKDMTRCCWRVRVEAANSRVSHW